jgi:hypothetical protein
MWTLGTILGDGYIDNLGRLYRKHSVKQKEYFFWKFEKLKKMEAVTATFEPKVRQQTHVKTGRIYETLYVRSKPIFQKERKLFYPNGVKIIPQDLHNSFDREALAVWYMDDGGRNSAYGSGMVIDVSGFSQECREYAKQMLLDLYGLETSFHVRGEKNVKLSIPARHAATFCELVDEFVIPEMKYKLTKPPLRALEDVCTSSNNTSR